MKRLQVGGLALIIDSYNRVNVGKVVRLLEFMGVYAWIEDGWMVEIEKGVNVVGETIESGVISAKHLMPLGDHYTQEILKKEKADVESVGESV